MTPDVIITIIGTNKGVFMNLILTRFSYNATTTIGNILLNGKILCFSLEDVVRTKGVKVHGVTAIPAGRYEVIMTFSNRFQKIMPLVCNVPMFDGIRMHGGNTAVNTDGCLLCAHNYVDANTVQGSAIDDIIIPTIKSGLAVGKVFIEIVDTFPYCVV
jgi:hypothetical protein